MVCASTSRRIAASRAGVSFQAAGRLAALVREPRDLAVEPVRDLLRRLGPRAVGRERGVEEVGDRPLGDEEPRVVGGEAELALVARGARARQLGQLGAEPLDELGRPRSPAGGRARGSSGSRAPPPSSASSGSRPGPGRRAASPARPSRPPRRAPPAGAPRTRWPRCEEPERVHVLDLAPGAVLGRRPSASPRRSRRSGASPPACSRRSRRATSRIARSDLRYSTASSDERRSGSETISRSGTPARFRSTPEDAVRPRRRAAFLPASSSMWMPDEADRCARPADRRRPPRRPRRSAARTARSGSPSGGPGRSSSSARRRSSRARSQPSARPVAHRHLDDLRVQRGQHAGQPEADRADVGVGRAAERGRAAAEDLGPGEELGVDLEPDDHLEVGDGHLEHHPPAARRRPRA